jgi:tRNA 2-thiouridine synthesizing protein A
LIVKPNLVIDTRGLFCPMPIMKTSEAVRQVDDGALVEIISDDPAIEHDLPAWCRSQGHSIEGSSKDGDVFHYFVRKVKRGND